MDRIQSFLAAALGVLVLLASSPLCAVDFYVNRLDDTNDLCGINGCSLREAIKGANFNSEYDTIHLPRGRIELSRAGSGEDGNLTGDLDISKSVTIVGKGPGVSTVDANSLDRVFHISGSGTVVIFQHLTITGGQVNEGGGGVLVNFGALVCQHCDIVGNQTLTSSDPGGGILVREGTLWLQDSSVRDNTALAHGGGIEVTGIPRSAVLQIDRSSITGNQGQDGVGGIAFYGTAAAIRDSTISHNTSTGLFVGGVHLDGDVTMEFCTLTGNTEPQLRTYDASTQVSLERTIIHGQCNTTLGGSIVTAYGNLESPGNTCGLDSEGDLYNVANPMLASLGLWGGPTRSHRPLPGSPAVDHVFTITLPGCPRPDQRGVSRPQDGSGGIGTPCDIGAVELIHNEIFLDDFDIGYPGAWSSATP